MICFRILKYDLKTAKFAKEANPPQHFSKMKPTPNSNLTDLGKIKSGSKTPFYFHLYFHFDHRAISVGLCTRRSDRCCRIWHIHGRGIRRQGFFRVDSHFMTLFPILFAVFIHLNIQTHIPAFLDFHIWPLHGQMPF